MRRWQGLLRPVLGMYVSRSDRLGGPRFESHHRQNSCQKRRTFPRFMRAFLRLTLKSTGSLATAEISIRMTQTRRNCSSSFLCRQGECLNSVSVHPSNWTGNADSGGNLPAFVQNWSRNTSRPKVCLLIVHREPLLHDSRKLFPTTRETW